MSHDAIIDMLNRRAAARTVSDIVGRITAQTADVNVEAPNRHGSSPWEFQLDDLILSQIIEVQS